jgi:peptidoglycan/LPS O-acetylase OafA/YrhL
MQKVSSLSYRADIDGIRAVAVMLVVVFHFHLVPGIKSGFIGVDLFFVISGFLITSIVQRQLDSGTFRLTTFWVHRVRRLAPALVATTVLTLCAGWLWLLPVEFTNLAQQTIAAQLYFANIFYWRNVNYFGLQAHDVYLLHTWSLAVEEQFYIFFPIALLLISKVAFAKRRLTTVLACMTLCSFALNLYFVGTKPEATFYLMPTRAWELLAGSLLALFVARRDRSHPVIANATGFAAVALLAIALLTYREDISFPGVFALLPVASGVLFILSGSLGESLTSQTLSRPWLTYFGKISYPLYLVHWPVNVFATTRLGSTYTWQWRLGMLVLSIALAAAIFHGVEGPIRRWLENKKTGRVLSWYVASLTCAVAASIFVTQTQGVPKRFPESVLTLANYSRDLPPARSECAFSGTVELDVQSMCRLGDQRVQPKWFVYGDSHAWAASASVDIWLKKTGQSAVFMFLHSCPPLKGVYVFRQGATCFDSNAAAVGLLAKTPSLSHVFLISTWHQAAEGILTTQPEKLLSKNDSLALFSRQFIQTTEQLRKVGKLVYVWEPLPGARVSVPQSMARSAMTSTDEKIDFSEDEYRADFSFFFAALEKQRGVLAGQFSPSRELCGSGLCVSAVNGAPLYYDNAHLAFSQRQFWADALARQMPAGN